LPVLALALVAVSVTVWAEPPRREAADGPSVRGKVVRVSGDSFIVRTDAGKEVTLYSGPKSVYRRNDKAIRFEDIREGMPISAVYATSGDRYMINTLTLADDRAAPTDRPAAAGESIRGRILRASSDPNHLVIQTADGKEMILYLDGRSEASFTFDTREGKRMLTSMMTAAPAAAGGREEAATPTTLSGTIVRVAGPEKRFIVRTADGREVIFDTDTATTYAIDGSTAFTDLRPGAAVDVTYAVRDRRHFANRVSGRPRR